jgi:KDO2-lipid IV(A) lauroyltransferase
MRFSFTRFKDHTADKLYAFSNWLSRQPGPVQKIGLGTLKGAFWLLYYVPASHMRKTAVALQAVVGRESPKTIYRDFVNGVLLFVQRIEMLSNGQKQAIDDLLHIPDQERLDAIIRQNGGALLALPHCHGALPMVRGLAARYDVLMLIREPKKEARAKAQRRYFANMGCEVLDVRRSNEAIVARTVLKALRSGKLVIGTVDRIRSAPPEGEPISKEQDNVRATAFDAPVGVPGWPARFAAKCKVPILPVMVEQTGTSIILHLGQPIVATDVLETTQLWLSALEQFFKRFPGQWIFVYDKHWSRLLRSRLKRQTG